MKIYCFFHRTNVFCIIALRMFYYDYKIQSSFFPDEWMEFEDMKLYFSVFISENYVM